MRIRLVGRIASASITLVVLLGCTSPVPPTPGPTDSPAPTATLTPSAAVTSTPLPVLTPFLDATPTPRPTLHVNGLATVAVNHLVESVPPEIVDPRGKIRLALGSLDIGETVFVAGRREYPAGAYWEIGRTAVLPNLPLGLVPELAPNGVSTLFPYAPACPHEDVLTDQALIDLGGLTALVCFGRRELALTGDVDCYRAGIDAIIAGPEWLTQESLCTLNGEFGLNGPAVTALLGGVLGAGHVSGTYLAWGHYDDPAATACGWIPFGTSGLQPAHPGEPAPVFLCRQMFVVTMLSPID